jgi:ABC-type nickel/cobalt efflux system permease component RcnA
MSHSSSTWLITNHQVLARPLWLGAIAMLSSVNNVLTCTRACHRAHMLVIHGPSSGVWSLSLGLQSLSLNLLILLALLLVFSTWTPRSLDLLDHHRLPWHAQHLHIISQEKSLTNVTHALVSPTHTLNQNSIISLTITRHSTIWVHIN